MKKQQVDHVLRAAGEITDEKNSLSSVANRKPLLLELLAKTPISAESRERIRGFIDSDFA